MKKLAFTTAIALALTTAAYAQDHHGGGGGRGPGPGVSGGGSAGFSAQGAGPGAGPGASLSARGSSGLSNGMGTSRGPSGNLYNHATTNMDSYKQGGPNLDRDRHISDRDQNRMGDRDHDRFSDRDQGRRLYNRADRDHDFDRDRHEGNRNFDHRGVVSGNFFEHGHHFRFRRFFNGEWVFLTAYDDCTAWAWVNVAPAVWAWRPVDICIG